MEASLALQRGIVAAWTADAMLRAGGIRLFDGPPADARPPYATVGQDVVVPRYWAGATGSEHRFQLTVWDSAAGVAGLKQMMADGERAVVGIGPVLDGWRVVSLRLLRATVKANPKQWNQGVLEFRALMEKERQDGD